MKVRLDVGETSYTVELAPQDDGSYRYSAGEETSGSATAVEVMPGLYSIVEETRSWLVTLAEGSNRLEAWYAGERYLLTVSDPRDHASHAGHSGASGPLEIRSLMPGKVIRVLVDVGASVTAGEGLVVVEAMKMQNELKSPRDGRVARIDAIEATTVLAGATLIVLE